MQLKQLEYIKMIADEGSITKAAEKMFISQQALSEMLKSLEKEIDFKIFQRSKKGVVATAEGEKFLDDINIILGLAAGWKQLAENQHEMRKVKILVQYIFGELFASEFFIRKTQSLQGINIEWDTMTASNIFEEIKQNKNYFGIFMPKVDGKLHQDILELQQKQQYIVELIMNNKICLLLKQDDSLAKKDKIYISDLAGKTFLANQRMVQLKNINVIIKATGKDAYVLPYSASIIDFLHKTTNAFAYIPDNVARIHPRVQSNELVIRYLEEDTAKMANCYLVYHKDNVFVNTEIVKIIKEMFSIT